ncbi:MAG: hypothetical protein R3C53_21365 [Pirellulaceae bacterium]
MNKHVEYIVVEYGLLYGLSPGQQSKLLTAALLDARKFMRRLRGDEVPDPPDLIQAKMQAERIGVQLSVPPCIVDQDILGADSYFAKMHAQLVTAEQRKFAEQRLVVLRKSWVEASTWGDLLNWLSRRSRLSVGQKARLNSVLLRSGPKVGMRTATDLLAQLGTLAPEQLGAILSEHQLTEIDMLMQACGISRQNETSSTITQTDGSPITTDGNPITKVRP